jgi:hypothetical protein
MVWAHFKNKQRENPKENSEDGNKEKMPKIRMDPIDWERCQKEENGTKLKRRNRGKIRDGWRGLAVRQLT